MKKTLIAMMLLGLVGTATAGQKLVVAEPTAPVETSSWAVELGESYNFALNQFAKSQYMTKKNHVNQLATSLTGVYNIDENQAVTLRFQYGYGSDKFALTGDSTPNRLREPNIWMREREHTFALMPGYRYTANIDDKWGVFVGASVGIANEGIKLTEHVQLDARTDLSASTHHSAYGFAYAVETGVKYNLTENTYIMGTLSFSGNTAQPKLKYDGNEVLKGKSQMWLGAGVSVGVKF